MTLDDLEKEFWGDQREQPTRVRLARVVRAIRDGMVPETQRPRTVSTIAVRRFCDEILASAGEGEAAGASTRKDEEAATHGQSTPAADSASVCEWRAGRDGIQAVAACGIPNNYWLETAKRLGVKTCACGRPIKLVEAK